MDSVPKKPGFVSVVRKPLTITEKYLPLAKVDPNLLTFLGIALSVPFVFVKSIFPLNAILVTVILLLDFLDGAAARKSNKTSREGYLIDVTFDRLSEGLMFIAIIDSFFGKLFFLLFIINILLSFYSVRTGKHRILALRFVFVIYLLLQPLLHF